MSEEETSDEYEDVDLGGIPQQVTSEPDQQEAEPSGISIVLDAGNTIQQAAARKKAVATLGLTKKTRLDVHKMHVMCLMAHAYIRNSWCNDGKTQEILRKRVDATTKSQLTTPEKFSTFDRVNIFKGAIFTISDAWRAKFRVISTGTQKSSWWAKDGLDAVSLPAQAEGPTDRVDFQRAAAEPQGSADLGVQLFCAMLRSIGVETRLVCSLQPLPFGSTTTRPAAADIKAQKSVSAEDNSDSRDNLTDASASSPKPLKRITRIGQRITSAPISYGVAPKPLPDWLPAPKYPVFWVEAFCTVNQEWFTVVPFSQTAVTRKADLEPPLSERLNQMDYVMALASDGSIKDLTRKYASTYNAKTIKRRVDSEVSGRMWLDSAMEVFRGAQDFRGDTEDAELARKGNLEGMPKSASDFKDHPVFALESQLRSNQIISPKNKVGNFSTGRGGAMRLEPVYRRENVVTVRSAENWFKLGRELKPHQQPLKHMLAKRQRSEDDEDEGIGLYASFQTVTYKPPPVVNGKVPKNKFGNIDPRIPWMIPVGAVHIQSAEAIKAAKLLGVDYAPTFVGWEYKNGLHAKSDGIVVAAEFGEAIYAVLEAFEYDRYQGAIAVRRELSYRRWKRLYQRLDIRRRVSTYHISGEQDVSDEVEEAIAEAEAEVGTVGEDNLDINNLDVASPPPQTKPSLDDPTSLLPLLKNDYLLRNFAPAPLNRRGKLSLGRRRPGKFTKTKKVSTYLAAEAPSHMPDSDDDAELDYMFGGSSPTGQQQAEQQALLDSFTPANNTDKSKIPGEESSSKIHDGDESSPVEIDDFEGGGFIPEDSHEGPAEGAEEARLDENVQEEDEGNETDIGSMLSHDPEDEDAEPDWLDDQVV
ncbi:Rad4-domain-containing protein [Aulographum hederae CBS 113979]|uniref:Rad4-domain-containing protein n=1 Tax=Aulographum hederae CBS 113979 TaxID=1176131 RepID=A0A6G1GVF6_9PEZI|nr:Rad4-domain-containing protein [Aulographum hederae CBS 113979]